MLYCKLKWEERQILTTRQPISPSNTISTSKSSPAVSPIKDTRKPGVMIDDQSSFSEHVPFVFQSCHVRPYLTQHATKHLVQTVYGQRNLMAHCKICVLVHWKNVAISQYKIVQWLHFLSSVLYWDTAPVASLMTFPLLLPCDDIDICDIWRKQSPFLIKKMATY